MPRAPEPATTLLWRLFWKAWERTYILVFFLLVGLIGLVGFRFGWLTVGRGFGALFVLAGVSTVLYAVRAMGLARQSVNWPTAEARVTSSRVQEDISTSRSPSGMIDTIVSYFPEVEYEYDVHGLTYSSSRILFVKVNYPKQQAETTVARYPTGGKATAYVHPRNARLAVLEPGLEGHENRYRKAIAVGTVFAVAGAATWLLIPWFAGR